MRSAITDFVLMLSSSVGLMILAKATVILLLGITAGALAVRAQAARRHLVFATTFAAVLALPVVVAVIPGLSVELPVAETVSVREVAPANTTAIAVADRAVASSASQPETAAASWSLPSLTTFLLLAWVTGSFGLMLLLVVDLLRVQSIRRHGLPSEQLREVVNKLAIEARVRAVDVMLHEMLRAPVTFGFFRPVVMLPAGAENWSEADLRRAIVHELEHIRRADWVTQLAARVACAFYWFHPLVWMAWRRLCLEAERACDDAVVRGAGNTEYAEQLVSLSRQLAAGRGQPVLGMAKRSDLARRVSALLDTTRARGRAGFAAAALSVLIGSLVVGAIGSVRAVAQVAPQPAPEKQISKVDINSSDNDDRGPDRLDSALLKAAEINAIDRARTLIEEGADPNAMLPGDGTPLIAASREGNLEMVRLLLDSGAKPNLGIGGDGNPLLNAAREGYRDVVVLLLDRGADINAGVEGDGNALIMSAGEGRADIVTLLLDRGADIHKVVRGDENAIIKACEQGQLAVVKLLVARGADVNSRVAIDRGMNADGGVEVRTPISMARRNGHTAIVEYLLSVGAKQ